MTTPSRLHTVGRYALVAVFMINLVLIASPTNMVLDSNNTETPSAAASLPFDFGQDLIYRVTAFDLNATWNYWNFSSFSLDNYDTNKYNITCAQSTRLNLSTNLWEQNPAFSSPQNVSLMDEDLGTDLPVIMMMYGDYVFLPNLFYEYNTSGAELYTLYQNQLDLVHYDEYVVGPNWVKFYNGSSSIVDYVYVKVNQTSHELEEFMVYEDYDEFHMILVDNLTDYRADLVDVDWDVSVGDELNFKIDISSTVYSYEYFKYKITGFETQTVSILNPEQGSSYTPIGNDDTPPFPAIVIPVGDEYTIEVDVVLAECYNWDATAGEWVKGADFLGRTGEVPIAMANNEMSFPIVDGEDMFLQFLNPSGTDMSMTQRTYEVVFGADLTSLTLAQFNTYITFDVLDYSCIINASMNNDGYMTFMDVRAPRFSTETILSYTLWLNELPSNTTDDGSDDDGNDNEDTGDENGIPGYSSGLMAIGIIASLIIISRKRQIR